MIFARASAGRKPHTGEITETIVRTLIWCDANIAVVMVTVRPQAFSRAEITGASQVAHGPETRPETTDVAFARQRDTGLQVATLVTQLVPRLDHTRSIVQTVVWVVIKLQVEGAVLGVCGIRIIPLSQVSTKSCFSMRLSPTSKSCVAPYQMSTAWKYGSSPS